MWLDRLAMPLIVPRMQGDTGSVCIALPAAEARGLVSKLSSMKLLLDVLLLGVTDAST